MPPPRYPRWLPTFIGDAMSKLVVRVIRTFGVVGAALASVPVWAKATPGIDPTLFSIFLRLFP